MRRKKRKAWVGWRKHDGWCQKPEVTRALYAEIERAGGRTVSELAASLGWTYQKVLRQLIACDTLGLAVAEGPRGRLYAFGEELGLRRVWLAEALAEAWPSAG